MIGEPDRKMIGEINDVMNNTISGWTAGPQHRFPAYGQQRFWKRITKTVNRDGELSDDFERIPEDDMQLKLPFDID